MRLSNKLLDVNKDNILKYITPKDIFNHYISDKVIYNRSFSSPFREDKNPSFMISNNFIFRDFTTGEFGDCFKFVEKLYSINFYESLIQVIYDLNLQKHFNIITTTKTKSKKKASISNISNRRSLSGNFTLEVKRRPFEQHDIDYWNCHGISAKYLKIGKVYPISHYFINGSPFKAEKYAYVYVENKDNKITYKIYQPYSKTKKWMGNGNYSVWELWNLLPKKHDKLIITSSRKDALSIIENLNIPSTAFQSETVYPKKQVVEEILKRFKRVYLLLDNDYTKTTNWGQRHALKLVKQYGFTNLIIPDEYNSKDFSDLVCNNNRIFASNLIKNML